MQRPLQSSTIASACPRADFGKALRGLFDQRYVSIDILSGYEVDPSAQNLSSQLTGPAAFPVDRG
ncbi:MAG: hypothetical protein K8S25_06090, partial [Alphaproteobacteria bacterium]|nr:hypothetical protein [Alphaproteobacteria bacterium]